MSPSSVLVLNVYFLPRSHWLPRLQLCLARLSSSTGLYMLELGPCHNGLGRPGIADREVDDLRMWWAAGNMLSNQWLSG
jgi:hypothetical protein